MKIKLEASAATLAAVNGKAEQPTYSQRDLERVAERAEAQLEQLGIPKSERHQGGGEGYDRGGAYWGTPSNVWGVWDDDRNVVYVRASSREDAINKAKQ